MKNYKKNNNNLEDLIMILKETKELIATGKQLKTFIKDELPKIRKESKTNGYGIDKHNDGFSTQENIKSMNIRCLSFYSFSGSWGSSSTYSDISNLNFDLMKEYFIKYLNNHKDEIFKADAVNYRKYGYFGKLSRIYNGGVYGSSGRIY